MLCSPGDDCLGQGERWAVGRIVSPVRTAPQPVFQPPLRLAVVLSCLGVPASDEWLTLQKAAAQADGLGVELLVVVSEATLYDQIDAQIQVGSHPNVQLKLVPPDLADLQQLVS